MRLAPQETERFYRIWFALLHYINEQLHLVPDFPEAPGEQDVSPEAEMQVRDALWANDAVREQFIADNPAGLPDTDLTVVPVGGTESLEPFTSFARSNALPFFFRILLRPMPMGYSDCLVRSKKRFPYPFPF